MANHYTETEIKKAIKRYGVRAGFSNFIAKMINDKWEVTFTYCNVNGYEMHLRRGGIRSFSSLNTVSKCLKDLGVGEFKVEL